MGKLQYFTLATVISILGSNSIKISSASASVSNRNPNLVQNKETATESSLQNKTRFSVMANTTSYQLAQKSTSSNEDLETIETIQKRDKKIEGFKDLLKIDGVVPEVDLDREKSSSNGDEMMDALQNRQQKLQKLKEIKQAQDLLNEGKLNALKAEDINLKNVSEIEKIKKIVNNNNLDDAEIIDALQKENINIESSEKLEKIKTIVNSGTSARSESSDSDKLSATTAFRMFTIGIPVTILVFLIATPFVKGTFGVVKSNVDEKFGKPKVPDGSITLHNKALAEITTIGTKAEKINDAKFGNEEFKLLIQIKIDIAKKTEGYEKLGYGVDLLQAAIIAQKSFLKLESTELRYRSRKQQQFYQYVADNLEENVDKEAFAKKVKKKQVEILPLITTEEGRDALESYIKEINNISKYDLGLKLLSLFKKYDLQDFSILKKISDVVERLQGEDLLSPKDLISLVLENYDAFEQLAPILDIPKSEVSPTTYARILQVIGLENRHGKSYIQFKQLVTLLKSWEKPFKTINMVRNEYTSHKYQVPEEFKQEISGLEVYNQYAKYLPDL
ncbi:hypothetical protein I4641_18665 [Waterburya agarophytonicola K14]|uniref:Uncharacterized protein n=1 Tax=Waterburya agarophytonicola KI4 TaxID=2874699 RepID=A0A964FJA1_9CYAN|nr:hypothetical protein [Waterburya agarophytonicola]MCC0178994.1 hypothetical protein [Waterburya agarophytonicola KI4]